MKNGAKSILFYLMTSSMTKLTNASTVQIIETKELEQKTLENQLAESRVENEKARADTLTTREAILSEFAETMETELQCSICSELLVKVFTIPPIFEHFRCYLSCFT